MKRAVLWIAVLLLCSGLPARAGGWTLPDALAFARTNAPDAQIARQRIAASRALLQQAGAAFWPSLQVQSSWTRTDNPMNVFGAVLNQHAYSPNLDFNHVPDADNLNVRGVISAPIYAGGRNSAARKAAQFGVRAAEAEAQAIDDQLQFETVQAFHSILKTRRFVEAAAAAVSAFETNRVVAQRRLEAGTILKTELLDLDVRLGQAREDLARARNAAALALTAFRNLLGLEHTAADVTDSAEEISVPDQLDYSGRAELRAVELRINAAEAELRRAKGGYLPEVRVFAQADHDQGWEFNGSGDSYAAGVVAKWDIWDGQLTRGRVNEARARVKELREQARKVRLGIQLEVQRAELQLAESNERLTVTQETVRKAEESVRLTRARFEQGLALSTQLIDAETALTAARVRRAEAESDRRVAIAALRKAAGLPQTERD